MNTGHVMTAPPRDSATAAFTDTAAQAPAVFVLLELLHNAHLQCAELAYNLGRLELTNTHFRACREIVLAIAKIEDPRGIQ